MLSTTTHSRPVKARKQTTAVHPADRELVAIEKRYTARMRKAFREDFDALIGGVDSLSGVREMVNRMNSPTFLAQTEAVMIALLQEAAELGVVMGERQLESLLFSSSAKRSTAEIDLPDLADRTAEGDGPSVFSGRFLPGASDEARALSAKWARVAGGALIQGVRNSTRDRVGQRVANWIEQAGSDQFGPRDLAPDLPDLFTQIRKLGFGEDRAELITVTEATNAVNRGNLLFWLDVGAQGKSWRTAEDERVCPICGPLEGLTIPIKDNFPGGFAHPGAHPRCRCWIVVVNTLSPEDARNIFDRWLREQESRQDGPITPSPVSGGVGPLSDLLPEEVFREEEFRNGGDYVRAVMAIEDVHKVPLDIPKLPDWREENPFLMGFAEGHFEYRHRRSFEGFWAPRRFLPLGITMSTIADEPALTAVHELGHYLALASEDDPAGFLHETRYKELREAIYNSPPVKRLIRDFDEMHTVAVEEAGLASGRYVHNRNHLNYLLSDEELWARAYAQYIALRSGDDGLRRQLEVRRGKPGTEFTQWDDADFEAIAAEIDRAFERKGWR